MNLAEFRRKIAAANNLINKNSKYKLIVTPDEAANPYNLRRPSGITQLDIDTAGGAPAGGVTVISGPDSAGKTFLLYKYFAMNQRIYGEYSSILYAAVEFLPDYLFMRKLGCQVAVPDEMLDVIDRDRGLRRLPKLTKAERTEYRKEVGCLRVIRASTSEELLDGIRKAFESRVYRIIAIDSISALQSGAEAALDSLEDNPQQAANASLITRFMQKLHPLCIRLDDKSNDTSLIVTAQVRANRKKTEVPGYMARYMKDWSSSSGAHALKHGKLVDIQLWADGKEVEGKGENKRIIGKTMHWTITKQKGGGHDNISGEYPFLYDSPGDHVPALIATAIKYGAVKEIEGKLTFLHQSGSVLLAADDKPLKDIEGAQGLRNIFAESPQTELAIMRELVAIAGVEQAVIYRRGVEED